MKRHILIIALVASLFCGCKKQWDGCWYNRYSQEQVYMGLEGGEISITAHCEIVYTSTQVRSIDGEPENNLWHSYRFIYGIDTSIYPYTIDTEWCIIEHTAPRQMDITILPSEQKRELFIRLGGMDENDITHRTPDDGIWIYQGYSAQPKLPDRIYY